MVEPWWKSAVIYQIYPRSFCDRSGDGVGDLAGIGAHLDHIAELGVDAIWLSPIFPSPMADFGYDVADYCGVDPLFGSLADLDRLIELAHSRQIRVLLDWVPNHTSDQHPWFIESRSSRTSAKRDWYVWRDGDPTVEPNNWKAAFGGNAWTWDDATRQWYLHLFLPEQPELNWHHPEVVDAMHLAFNFPPLYAPWDADAWRACIDEAASAFDPIDAWPTWVLSNHDNPRHRSRYGGSEARARAAAVLLLGLRGTPFVYAGEELGLQDAAIPPHRTVDPGGRDGCRAPIPGDATPAHGWTGGPDPWLPWPPEADHRNAAELAADPSSILHLYRRLLAARQASKALSLGAFSWLPSPAGTLAWLRTADDDRRAVAVNFTGDAAELVLDGDWEVELASDCAGEGARWTGQLGADQAVVLRPA